MSTWRLDVWDSVKARINRHQFLPRLPRAASWWLGYRAQAPKPPPYPLKLLSILLTTLGAMLANFAVVNHAPLYQHHWHLDELVPSFAASCILIYAAVDAPFSQPRNLVLGHLLSGLIGVSIMKLFMTNSHNEKYLWIAGSLSVACASVVMDITGTTHPPSGATALLPSVDSDMRRMGWKFLPILLIHSCIYLGVALLCNNIVLRYPKYWLWPSPPPPPPPPEKAAPLRISISADGIDAPSGLDLSEEDKAHLKSLQSLLVLEKQP